MHRVVVLYPERALCGSAALRTIRICRHRRIRGPADEFGTERLTIDAHLIAVINEVELAADSCVVRLQTYVKVELLVFVTAVLVVVTSREVDPAAACDARRPVRV